MSDAKQASKEASKFIFTNKNTKEIHEKTKVKKNNQILTIKILH